MDFSHSELVGGVRVLGLTLASVIRLCVSLSQSLFSLSAPWGSCSKVCCADEIIYRGKSLSEYLAQGH